MKLHYRKYGSGTPFIILHGLYGSSDNWATIASRISGRFTVYVPDLRNHGQSPHSQDHSYRAMADDLRELVTSLGLSKFILAGHSMGGKVAMRYALGWPETLYSLLVIDITPFGTRDPGNAIFRFHSEILTGILNLPLADLTSRTEAENKLSASIRSEKIRGLIMKNLRRSEKGTFVWKINAEALLANLPGIMDTICDQGNDCQYISGFPVYFIKGEESDYIISEDFDRVRKIFPSAGLIEIRGAGHWVQADRPEAIEEIFMGQAEG